MRICLACILCCLFFSSVAARAQDFVVISSHGTDDKYPPGRSLAVGKWPVLFPSPRHDMFDRQGTSRASVLLSESPAEVVLDRLEHHSEPSPREQPVEGQVKDRVVHLAVRRPTPGLRGLFGEISNQ